MTEDEQAFRSYFLAIESAFGRLRARPLLLSPRDVALVRDWHAAHIPLEAIQLGLEQFFEREAKRRFSRRDSVTLAYCEKDIVLAYEELKASRVGLSLSESEVSSARPGPETLLVRASARLREVASSCEQGEARLAKKLQKIAMALEELTAEEGEQAADKLASELEKLDARIERALRAELGADEKAKLDKEAEAELQGYAERVKAGTWKALVEQTQRRLLFVRRGLPRLRRFVD